MILFFYIYRPEKISIFHSLKFELKFLHTEKKTVIKMRACLLFKVLLLHVGVFLAVAQNKDVINKEKRYGNGKF